MNPYKKIDRLEQRIQQLEQENQELRLQCREMEKCRKEYEQNNRLAVRYQTEYHQLLHGLKQEQEDVRQLIQRLKYETGKSARTYRRAFHDLRNDMRICKSHS